MTLLGDSFQEAILELELEAKENLGAFAAEVEVLWLDTTRQEIRTRGKVADRDSWDADTEVTSEGSRTVITGWTDFRGSKAGAERRFRNAQQHFEHLVDAEAANFDLLE